MSQTVVEDKAEQKEIEKRGKPLTCRYCKKTFKIENIAEKNAWQANDFICPLCGEKFCILPPTERKLKYLQDIYLENRDEGVFTELIYIMLNYTESIIKKKFSNALTFEDALEYYAYMAVSYLVEEYLRKPDFKVEISFAGWIIHKIRQSIYGKFSHTVEDISLDIENEEGNNLYEVIPDTKCIVSKIEEDEYVTQLYNRMCSIIEGVSNYAKNDYEDYIRTLSVYAYFKNGEKGFDKIFQSFGRDGKLLSMKTLEILRKELLQEN